MNRNQKIGIVVLSIIVTAILVGGLIWSSRLADRIDLAKRKVAFLEQASANYLNEAQVKVLVDNELKASGQISKMLVALETKITIDRDVALAPIASKVVELDTAVNSTTAADGLKVAMAKLQESNKRHETVIYGPRRGLVTSLITLAERYNTTQATVGINPDHVNTIIAAKNVAESDVKDRERLTVYNQMLAAVRGQTVDEYDAEAKARASAARTVTIKVTGERVEVDRVSVPSTGVE